jgi:5-methylcytosine-specific restriction protein A
MVHIEERLRGPRLQALRRQHFSLHPLCARCLKRGAVALATELDHILPLFKGGSDSDPSNKQGLCGECHKEKTAEDMGHSNKPTTGLDGWPV